MLFTKRDGNRVIGAVIVHVDDIIVTGTPSFLRTVGNKLKNRFKMSSSGPLDTYLSLKVERGTDNSIYLSQHQYIREKIEAHLPSDAKSANVPCSMAFSNLTSDSGSPPTDRPYSELLGMLQWIANGTRPDIQFAVNRLAQFTVRPTQLHWAAAIHIL